MNYLTIKEAKENPLYCYKCSSKDSITIIEQQILQNSGCKAILSCYKCFSCNTMFQFTEVIEDKNGTVGRNSFYAQPLNVVKRYFNDLFNY